MRERVYVEIDSPDRLLLIENVCGKLGIATYQPDFFSERVLKCNETLESGSRSHMKCSVILQSQIGLSVCLPF